MGTGTGTRRTHNHIKVIPAQQDEFDPCQDDDNSYDGTPQPFVNRNHEGVGGADSDKDQMDEDKTYVDEDMLDVDLSYDDGTEDGHTDSDDEEDHIALRGSEVKTTMSDRATRLLLRYRGSINISVVGLQFTVGQMHFTVASNDLTTPVLVFEDELPVLRAIMTQLSLREGFRRFGVSGKKGVLKEKKQLHDMNTFFP